MYVPITLVCIVEKSRRAVLDCSLSDVMAHLEECLSPDLQHVMTQALIKTQEGPVLFPGLLNPLKFQIVSLIIFFMP